MSVGFEDACDLENETWAPQTGDVDEVEARFPDNGRNRQRITTSAYQRAGTVPASGVAEFDVVREAWSIVSSIIPLGATAITARLESHSPPPARTCKKVSTPVNRVAKAKRDPVEISRHWRHLAFLKQVSSGVEPAISQHIASQSMHVWVDIRRATQNRMPVPAAVTGPDGQMFYSWDRGRHHMELEIVPGEPAFFFYRDRQTGETWSQDCEVGDRLTAGIVSRLELFFQD